MSAGKESKRDYFAKSLHDPSRTVDGMEEHLIKARCLSRALWELLRLEESIEGGREHDALRELAGEVAHHASAAEFLFHTGSSGKDNDET